MKKLLLALAVLALPSSAFAQALGRNAIPFGPGGSSWAAIVGSDPGAVNGLWLNSGTSAPTWHTSAGLDINLLAWQSTTTVTTATYTAAATDYAIIYNYSGTGTLTLPAGTTGAEYLVKTIAGAYITIQTSSSQLIDGASSFKLYYAANTNATVRLRWDGTQWRKFAFTKLQDVYDNGTGTADTTIVLDGTRKGLVVADSGSVVAGPLISIQRSTPLFEVANGGSYSDGKGTKTGVEIFQHLNAYNGNDLYIGDDGNNGAGSGSTNDVYVGNSLHNVIVQSAQLYVVHVVGNSSTPTIAAGPGAGTSPTVSLASGSTDLSGTVTVVAGTSPPTTGGNVFATVTFSRAYASRAKCTVNADADNGANAIQASFYVSSTTIAFQIIETSGNGLVAASTYSWNYICVQ